MSWRGDEDHGAGRGSLQQAARQFEPDGDAGGLIGSGGECRHWRDRVVVACHDDRLPSALRFGAGYDGHQSRRFDLTPVHTARQSRHHRRRRPA